jgi:hypothetical protein
MADKPAEDASSTKTSGNGCKGQGPLEVALPFVTPVVIAITAFLYLAGSSVRHVYLGKFGLSADLFSVSLHETISEGFFATIVGAAVMISIKLVDFGVKKLTGRWAIPRLRKKGAATWDHRIGITSVFLLLLAIYFVSCGRFYGGFRADIHAARVQGGCYNCHFYQIGHTQLRGMIVAQNSDQTAILTARGVRLIATSSITGVDTTESMSPSSPASSLRSGQPGNAASAAPQPCPTPSQPVRPTPSR